MGIKAFELESGWSGRPPAEARFRTRPHRSDRRRAFSDAAGCAIRVYFAVGDRATAVAGHHSWRARSA